MRLVESSGKPQAEIARELGIAGETLRSWVRQAQIDAGEREGRRRRSGRSCGACAGRCVLEEEREILKKAAAFFARETDQRR